LHLIISPKEDNSDLEKADMGSQHQLTTDRISQRSIKGSETKVRNKKLFLRTALSILAGMIIGLAATLILRFFGRGLNF
jgi:hypothetical protein